MTLAMIVNWRLSSSRSAISLTIGRPVHIDRPKSNRTAPRIQVRNCWGIGWSRPSFARSCCKTASSTRPPSPASFSRTMSPGTILSSTNEMIATPSSVGIISKIRLMM